MHTNILDYLRNSYLFYDTRLYQIMVLWYFLVIFYLYILCVFSYSVFFYILVVAQEILQLFMVRGNHM